MPAAIEMAAREPAHRATLLDLLGRAGFAFAAADFRATARRAISTTYISTMPAAIEMGAQDPDPSDVPRYHCARAQGSPIGGCSPPACGAIRASLPAGRRERPRSNPLRSCLTLRQPFGAKWAMLHGPCDPGNPSTARPIGHRLPGSHGPAEEKVGALRINIFLPFDQVAGSSILSFLPARGGPVSVPYPAAPIEAAIRRPPRSGGPLQASGPREAPQPKPRCIAPTDQFGCRGPTVRELLEKGAGCARAVLKFPGMSANGAA
jgi:hypothetical protein